MTNDGPEAKGRMTNLYTPAVAAAVLGVSRQRVLQWIEQGALSPIRLGSGSRMIRIHRTELDRFVEEDFKPDVPPR